MVWEIIFQPHHFGFPLCGWQDGRGLAGGNWIVRNSPVGAARKKVHDAG